MGNPIPKDDAAASALEMERTVWYGSTSEDDRQSMETWMTTAPADELERLANDVLDREDAAGQAFLAQVWDDCAHAQGRRADMHEASDGVTYHWGEGERIGLRRALRRLRPDQIDAADGQGALF